MGEQGSKILVQHIGSCTALRAFMHSDSKGCPEIVQSLNGCSFLKQLRLPCCPDPGQSAFAAYRSATYGLYRTVPHIAHLTSLQELDLHDIALEDRQLERACEHFTSLTALTALRINYLELRAGSKGYLASLIASLGRLQEFKIDDAMHDPMVISIVPSLVHLTGLLHISLSGRRCAAPE